ncbi:MAG: M17 family peptidase N-terminal domain-containing protein, partial [Betaproteobacteria bacterium]
MNITLSTTPAATTKTGTLVLGAFADGTFPGTTQAIDDASGGKLATIVKRGDLDAKTGSTLLIPDLPGVAAERVLLVALGKRAELDEKAYRTALAAAGKALASGVAESAAVTLAELDVPNRDAAWRLRTAARLLADAAYVFDAPRKEPLSKRGANAVTLLGIESRAEHALAVAQGLAVAEGMALTKDLGNHGGNVCNPAYMADTASALGKEFGFEVEVLERADMEKLGMHSAL